MWTLWAECDGVAAVEALSTFHPAPALVIGSGSGSNCHAYWPLCEPLAPLPAERANLRLATALGADRACFDATRVLRPPTTLNFKRRPPTPVRLLNLDRAAVYGPEEILRDVPALANDRLTQRWTNQPTRSTTADPLLRIPPVVYVETLLGVRPNRTGKVTCPFHADEHPSLHVYPTPERGWCCFSCRRGGSIYDLAADLWGAGTRGRAFVELRERLMDRFAIQRRSFDLER